jgi:UDP-glucose 4-epimerase
MKYLVTGGCGFIGHHIVQRLINDGNDVVVLDNLSAGKENNIPVSARLVIGDIRKMSDVISSMEDYGTIDGVFHLAAISRTPPTVKDPILAHDVNVTGSLNVLEAARQHHVKRVVLSSSNVIYAFPTMYRMSKQATDSYGEVYNRLYGLSTISLVYSNVYGKGLMWDDIAVFAALRKSAKEKGYIEVTGDGIQSRQFTHVSDIVEGNIKAMNSDYCGRIDLCDTTSWTLNEAGKFFGVEIRYLPEREGDIKHIIQDPGPAEAILGWKATIPLNIGIKDVLEDV